MPTACLGVTDGNLRPPRQSPSAELSRSGFQAVTREPRSPGRPCCQQGLPSTCALLLESRLPLLLLWETKKSKAALDFQAPVSDTLHYREIDWKERGPGREGDGAECQGLGIQEVLNKCLIRFCSLFAAVTPFPTTELNFNLTFGEIQQISYNRHFLHKTSH